MSKAGLINQARGDRYDVQERLVSLSRQYPGYTMTQLSWILAGGTIDEKGYCQPAEAFNQMLTFFNAKRRGSEIACNAGQVEDKPRAKLTYGKALRNPYDFGGMGVYPKNMPQQPVQVSKPVPLLNRDSQAPDLAVKQQALGDAFAALED